MNLHFTFGQLAHWFDALWREAGQARALPVLGMALRGSRPGRRHTDQTQAVGTQCWRQRRGARPGAGLVALGVGTTGRRPALRVGSPAGANRALASGFGFGGFWSYGKALVVMARRCALLTLAGTMKKPTVRGVLSSPSLPLSSPGLLWWASPSFRPHPEQSQREEVPWKPLASSQEWIQIPMSLSSLHPRLCCRHLAPNHDALARGQLGTKLPNEVLLVLLLTQG